VVGTPQCRTLLEGYRGRAQRAMSSGVPPGFVATISIPVEDGRLMKRLRRRTFRAESVSRGPPEANGDTDRKQSTPKLRRPLLPGNRCPASHSPDEGGKRQSTATHGRAGNAERAWASAVGL